MVSPATLKRKGWFTAAGRDGDRTLDQQMTGLDLLLAEVAGKTILDAGCAEGLISHELARRGAKFCTGLEIVPGHVEVARELAGDLPCWFEVANLNEYDVSKCGPVDVVLMLAILHKLKNPSAVCAALAGLALDLCVIRLPPSGLVIVDARSNNEPHDIGLVMDACGFYLEGTVAGPFDEYLGYFRRRETKAQEPETELPASETPPPETETNDAAAQAEVQESQALRTHRARRSAAR